MNAPFTAEKPTSATTSLLEWVSANVGTQVAQYKTPQEYFTAFLRDLRQAGVTYLEQNRNTYSKSNETALTGVLVARLGIYDVSTETNSNGHPDIFVKSHWPGVAWKGEAKILKTPNWYFEGLVKLVEKYNSGVENDTVMIGFCKAPNMHQLRKDYFAELTAMAIGDFSAWTKGPDDPEAVSEHKSNGNPIRVHHVWANCHYETDKKLLERKLAPKLKKKVKRVWLQT